MSWPLRRNMVERWFAPLDELVRRQSSHRLYSNTYTTERFLSSNSSRLADVFRHNARIGWNMLGGLWLNRFFRKSG